MTTLAATVRTETGKGNARKLRADGQLPAVMYGKTAEAVPLAINPKELLDIFRQSQNRNTIVEIEVDGDTVPCLVREVQRHPVSRELRHVDFYQVTSEEPVDVKVPVRTEGRPKGELHGGRLKVLRRELGVRCDYDKIPEAFVLDVAPMEIGDRILASEIETPEGVELTYDHDFNVVMMKGKLKMPKFLKEELEAEEESLLPAAEPEEGEAAEGEEGEAAPEAIE